MSSPAAERPTLAQAGTLNAGGAVSSDAARPGAVLFTAFEPSGDDHASGVIAELKRRHPQLTIYGWGGQKMEKAGATVIERTGENAVMGIPGLAKIREHQQINQRIAAWLEQNKVVLHVPVDSPAANFPICELTRAKGCKIVHLVAPQIWAWGRWRIHKLRRLTDLVLCLLPFEEGFFVKRNVPAKFIGHVLFDKVLDFAALDAAGAGYLKGEVRLALMPGSRPQELKRNFPLLLDVFAALRAKFPGAVGMIAATTPKVEGWLKEMAAAWCAAKGVKADANGWPPGLACAVTATDTVIRWCTLALVKSGTVTLQVAKQNKPMVIFYKKANPVTFFLARSILATKMFTLPNVIARKFIVPEFVPHFGGPRRIIEAAAALISNPEAAAKQKRDLAEMTAMYADRNACGAAADAIESFVFAERA